MENKAFEAGKNSRELGIDTTRKFVVVDGGNSFFKVGEVVSLLKDDVSDAPLFAKERDGKRACCYWYRLAYADGKPHKTAKPKPIVALVVWEEDRDPVKEFTKFSEAKKFAKELMTRPEVKKDSVKLYEIKRQYKMVAKTSNKLVQVK